MLLPVTLSMQVSGHRSQAPSRHAACAVAPCRQTVVGSCAVTPCRQTVVGSRAWLVR